MRRTSLAAVGVAGVTASAVLLSRRRRRTPLTLVSDHGTTVTTNVKPHRTIMRLYIASLWQPGIITTHADPSYFTTSWFTGFSGLARAVVDVAGFLLGPVVDLVEGVYSFFGDLFKSVWKDIESLSGWIYELGNEVVQNAYQFGNALFDLVSPIIHAITDPILSLAQQAWGYIDSFAGNIWAYVEQPVEAAIDLVFRPLMAAIDLIKRQLGKFLDDPLGYIEDLVGHLIHRLINDAINALSFAGELCAKIVDTGLSWALGITGSAIATLKAVWHIFEWVALHPIDALEQIVKETVKSVVADDFHVLKGLVDSHAGEIENLISDLIGL